MVDQYAAARRQGPSSKRPTVGTRGVRCHAAEATHPSGGGTISVNCGTYGTVFLLFLLLLLLLLLFVVVVKEETDAETDVVEMAADGACVRVVVISSRGDDVETFRVRVRVRVRVRGLG